MITQHHFASQSSPGVITHADAVLYFLLVSIFLSTCLPAVWCLLCPPCRTRWGGAEPPQTDRALLLEAGGPTPAERRLGRREVGGPFGHRPRGQHARPAAGPTAGPGEDAPGRLAIAAPCTTNRGPWPSRG